MTEPNTANRALIVPNTGDLVGAWGTAALNPNFNALDGMFGGVASISLSSATTFALTAPSGSITPSAGPVQQQNAMISLSGTLTGNSIIIFTLPGYYIINNQCTVGSFVVTLAPLGLTGTLIGAPPGRKCHVFYDGSNMDYVNMPEVGSALDLHGATVYPPWMSACTVLPYLIKDGTIHSTSSFPALGALLGSTFGGNGITTFGVPDERARVRVAWDFSSTGRLTGAVSGVSGNIMGSAGGDQSLQAHGHGVADPGHNHISAVGGSFTAQNGPSTSALIPGALPVSTSTTNISILSAGAGASQNVQPSIVSFLALIKT